MINQRLSKVLHILEYTNGKRNTWKSQCQWQIPYAPFKNNQSKNVGKLLVQFSTVHLLGCVWHHGLPYTRLPWQSPNPMSLCKLMPIESVMPSNHLILCCPFVLLPSIFPSIRVFSNKSALHIRWPKYWSFKFGISPSNECSGLVSFKMDWLDEFAVQGTLNSLLLHHNLKTSILWRSAFFIVQISHPYMTTGKNIALTRQNF